MGNPGNYIYNSGQGFLLSARPPRSVFPPNSSSICASSSLRHFRVEDVQKVSCFFPPLPCVFSAAGDYEWREISALFFISGSRVLCFP